MLSLYNLCMLIDLVISYVNNNDEIWRKAFVDYCISTNQRQKIVNMARERYNGTNWLKYQLKLVDKNMPFVNRIYLLVSNIEQVKDLELNDKIEVVLHKDFIPKRFLPTFNSTSIEMFLWNIPNLSEYFIYANDDMLPTMKLNESDFFENDKTKINWQIEKYDNDLSQFKTQCFNNCLILKCNPISKEYKSCLMSGYLMRPQHTMIPLIKSHCIECYNLFKKHIDKTISAFRTYKNYNQYLFSVYEEYRYGTLKTNIDFYYTEFKEPVNIKHQIICANVERNFDYVKEFCKELDKLCE